MLRGSAVAFGTRRRSGGVLDEHDGERLVQYALRLGNRAVLKRSGYLLESPGSDEPS